jgi:hypothetical protein
MYVGINNLKGGFNGQGAPLLDLDRSPPQIEPKATREQKFSCHVHLMVGIVALLILLYIIFIE